MEHVDLVLRVLGTLFSGLALTLGIIKQRDIWIERGRRSVPVYSDALAGAISAVNVRMRLLEVTLESEHTSLEQCERERALAHKALDAWDRLIGNIWVEGRLDEATNSGE